MVRTKRRTRHEGPIASALDVPGLKSREPEWSNLGGRSIAPIRAPQSERLPGFNPPMGDKQAYSEASPGAFEPAGPPETIELDRLGGDLLRRRWRSVMGRHPPKTLSRALLVRVLTWREQVLEVGDVSPRSRAILAAAFGGEPEAGGPFRPRHPIRAGTVVVREHVGVLHRVTVTADGFEWNGRVFGSLSAVARAITGVSWSGRRFFGLDRGLREGVERSSPGKPNTASRAGGPP